MHKSISDFSLCAHSTSRLVAGRVGGFQSAIVRSVGIAWDGEMAWRSLGIVHLLGRQAQEARTSPEASARSPGRTHLVQDEHDRSERKRQMACLASALLPVRRPERIQFRASLSFAIRPTARLVCFLGHTRNSSPGTLRNDPAKLAPALAARFIQFPFAWPAGCSTHYGGITWRGIPLLDRKEASEKFHFICRPTSRPLNRLFIKSP